MADLKRRARRPQVEVRLLRRGRALRIDGTFASWYAPGSHVTGSVWDALAAPLLLLPPARRRKVLILGLGGGSAARVVRAIAPRAHIVGIELSRDVVHAARRWLDLDGLGIEILHADAHEWLRASRRRFDAVLEDVFVGRGRAVRKPDWLPLPGLALAARRIAPGGILASNAIDEASTVAREMQRLFPSTLAIAVEGFDNRVLVGGPRPLEARALRSALAKSSVLRPTLPQLSVATLRRPKGRS
jgi:spermidine synthase